MSEIIRNSPLEIIRQINDEAEELDRLLLAHQCSEDSDYTELSRMVADLDARHPLMGQEVIVYGTALTMSIDDEGGMRPLAIPPYCKSRGVAGTYHGFAVRNAYDPEADHVTDKLTHILQTSSATWMNEFFHATTTNYLTYVCVDGSEVVPVLPYNAHSLRDLQKDRIVEEFDAIVFGEEPDPRERFLKLSRFAAEALGHAEFDNDLNHQRVSYLNSLGILDGIMLQTRDMAVAPSRQAYVNGDAEAMYADQSVIALVEPDVLDLLPGYTWLADGTILPGGAPELCATTPIESGRVLITPLKHLIDVQLVA